jgi:hypothetical protein
MDFVDDYLHELLTEAESDLVEAHCRKCSICEAALAEARKRASAFEAVPTCEATEQLIQDTVAAIETRDRAQTRRRKYVFRTVFGAAAAAMLILGAFHLYYLNLTPGTAELNILGQKQLLAATSGSLRICLLDRATGHGLPGVPVKIEMRDRQNRIHEIGRFTTDDEGTGQPQLQLPDWEDGDYQLQITARSGWFSADELTQTVKLKRSWRLMLTSDKPVYQPGQTIRVRSLALRRPDLKPVGARAVTFSITDPKGNVIFKRNDVTSKHGIAAIDCPLASELIEGVYTIASRIDKTESKLQVEVKKYVLPKFKIDVQLAETFYQPGQRVEGKIQANYFYGKPVNDASVEIHVQDLNGLAALVPDIKATTDATGQTKFDFALPANLAAREQDGVVRFGVKATVTDSAGQKETRGTISVASSEVLRVEAIPEAGALVRGVTNRVYVFVGYPDGRPAAKARVVVSDRDEELGTNDFGITWFDCKPDGRDVSWTIKATDAKDHVGRRTVKFRPGSVRQDFILRTDKAVYDGGDLVTVAAVAEGVEPIFVDLIKDGQTMLTEAVPVKNGRGAAGFALPAELSGTLELCAYRFSTAGVPLRKTRTLYVRQASQLKIDAKLDRTEYRPGAPARMSFTLKDSNGKPVAGALSLSAVDEAVYAVLPQRPGTEGTYYGLEQRLLKPVYDLYAWSPDKSGQDDPQRNDLEQALFARTTQVIEPTGSDGKGNPHSLTGTNFPEKQVRVTQARETGLGRVHAGWIAFFALLALAGTIHVLVVWQPWVAVNNWLEELEERQLVRSKAAELLERVGNAADPALGSSQGGLGVGGCAVVAALLVLVALAAIQMLGKNANSAFGTVGASVGAVAGSGDEPRIWRPALPTMKSERPPVILDVPKSPPRPILDDDRHVKVGVPGPEPEIEEMAPLRLREYFPETLLWRPELITDTDGQASLDIELADSITTWRLSTSAVTSDGRLGAASEAIKVFQPFFVDVNLPVSLTRGDEVAVPVIVSSYLDKPQTVTLELKSTDWFELLDEQRAKQTVALKPGERFAIKFPIRVRKVGPQQPLTVEARGPKMSDAVKRVVEVVPDGQKIERVVNGTLLDPVNLNLAVPVNAIEGSPKLFLKVYPSNFSQLVEGLDNIFRMPSGCFEQTSSTTYPNILALDYLRRTGKSVPAVQIRAKQYIHTGYQRLLSFEVPGGGFDWFGRPPANRTLTAYGLMEFVDMAKVHDVDPEVIRRTRDWLLSQRQADGSWLPEGHDFHDGPGARSPELARYSTTAYIGWAVFEGNPDNSQAWPTRNHLVGRRPEAIQDPYVLALVCNALLTMDRDQASPYLDALWKQRRGSDDGKLIWWEQSAGRRTAFYGAGVSGNIETTALASLALIRAGERTGGAHAALTWLARQKDANGTWHSTQATVLALKALVAGTGKALADDQSRQIEIKLGKDLRRKVVITADQAEVMQQLDLSDFLQPGDNELKIKETSGSGAGYQVAFRYHVPATERPAKVGPLAIDMSYDRTDLAINDTVTAIATVRNQMQQASPMVMVELPIPPSFAVDTETFAKLVEAGTIARYQMTGRSVLIYLRGLDAGKSLELQYTLRATLPANVAVPPARAYEYYDPAKQAHSLAARLTVSGR